MRIRTDPVVEYSYTKKAEITGVKAITGIEDTMSDCSQNIAEVTIDQVIYQDNSDYITGFRVKPTKTNQWPQSFTMYTKKLYEQLSNSQRLNVQMIIKNGAQLLVVYQQCGSGGYISVKDVFKKSALLN